MAGRTITDFVEQTKMMMRQVVDEAESRTRGRFQSSDPALYDVIRYHLGWVDEQFAPVEADPGKRVRPMVCLLSAGAAGGDPQRAIPIAAGIELLHNFTLMHDDIQDRSELRRGRHTVWQVWGEAQAINAGDATFALSQLALLKAGAGGCNESGIVEIVAEFNRMTLQIVEGQVLDLGFVQRSEITADDYLRMIDGKTAAIVAFAAWAGAMVAGKDTATCRAFHEFGRLLGTGFQIRDDYLGIWGDATSTGKQPGDDIRGRKQSIPIILLLESLSPAQRAKLEELYTQEVLEDVDVAAVTEMLDSFGIADRVQQLTETYHDQALTLIHEIAEPSDERDALVGLAEQLVERAR